MKFFLLAGLTAMALSAQTTTIDVTLGQSAQNFVEYGLGGNGLGNATWDLQQGACGLSGTTTTCTLSGAFTGTSAGFTGGTYSFVTTYAGTSLAAIQGISENSSPNYFNYSSLDPSVSMVLNLTPTNGTPVSESLVSNGSFVDANFSFNFTGTYSCSGTAVATCDPYNVGLTNGAIGQAPVITTVSFDVASTPVTPVTPVIPTATPEPAYSAVLGLVFVGVAGYRLRKPRQA